MDFVQDTLTTRRGIRVLAVWIRSPENAFPQVLILVEHLDQFGSSQILQRDRNPIPILAYNPIEKCDDMFANARFGLNANRAQRVIGSYVRSG